MKNNSNQNESIETGLLMVEFGEITIEDKKSSETEGAVPQLLSEDDILEISAEEETEIADVTLLVDNEIAPVISVEDIEIGISDDNDGAIPEQDYNDDTCHIVDPASTLNELELIISGDWNN